MGNKTSSAFPSADQLSSLADTQDSTSIAPYDSYVRQWGLQHGPAMRAVSARLQRLLDPQFIGMDKQALLCITWFYCRASLTERMRVIFSMYESQGSPGYINKEDLLILVAEMAFANAEWKASSACKVYKDRLQQSGRFSLQTDPSAAPFKDLTVTMVEILLCKYDEDHDGRLSLVEFMSFAQDPASGVIDLIECMVRKSRHEISIENNRPP